MDTITVTTTTGFSRLATDSEGPTTTGTNEIINSNLNQQQNLAGITTTEVENHRGEQNSETNAEQQHNNCATTSDNIWKQNYYPTEHPLQAATTALLNVAADDYQHSNGHHQQFVDDKDDKINNWSAKDEDGRSKIGLISESFFRSAIAVNPKHHHHQANNGSTVSGSGFNTLNELGKSSVVRLAGSIKMEYPHHSDSDGNGPTVVMSTSSSHHESVVMHPQHVEVIKTAGHVPPLHSNNNDHQHHMNSKEDQQNNSVLQEMSKMRLPSYEQYQPNGGRASTLYGQVASGVYDSLAPSTPNYGPLTNQHSILQQPYANLLATSGQESYYSSVPTDYYPMRIRPLQPMYSSNETTEEIMDRISRHVQPNSSIFTKPINVEMPSPVDSGLGPEIMVTPKQEAHDAFGYEMHGMVQAINQRSNKDYPSPRGSGSSDRIVTSRESPVNIPKIVTSLGFQYTLESPNSTSVRKEDDRMTYINKGQFYSVSLDYIHDPNKPLKSQTVKSLLLLVFRDDKPYEEEIKCWTFWHARQHSAKQRILDVDAKNSSGVVGPVEEIAHNAISFYWNPAEQPAKVNIAVQCLSTDFSNQKGVKGFPLHLQVDTYDESQSKNVPFHRGYCQIKVFCDKGANRKMLHEQRRDEKRRMQGRKKSDGEYHDLIDRSEFYHMSNLMKPAVLFVPPEDYERPFPSLETFYIEGIPPIHPTHVKEENGADSSSSPPAKRPKSSTSERGTKVVIYVRKSEENVYTPLNLEPPTLEGLINAISKKYNVVKSRITGVFKQCRKGITVKFDDDMIRHYCNEDSFMLQFTSSEDGSSYSITLIELDVANSSNCSSPS